MSETLDKLLAMAVKPKGREPKPVKTFVDKFRDAIRKQHENLMDSERAPTKTDWFQRVGDIYHVRIGRKKIGVVSPDGVEVFYFEAANPEQVNHIFLLAEQLLDESPDFRAKVLEQYGSEEEKAAAENNQPKQRRGRRKKVNEESAA